VSPVCCRCCFPCSGFCMPASMHQVSSVRSDDVMPLNVMCATVCPACDSELQPAWAGVEKHSQCCIIQLRSCRHNQYCR
jgi:hypothetical protein